LSIIFLTNGFTNWYDMGETLTQIANLITE